MGLAIKEKKTWLSVLWVLPNSKHGAQQLRVWVGNIVVEPGLLQWYLNKPEVALLCSGLSEGWADSCCQCIRTVQQPAVPVRWRFGWRSLGQQVSVFTCVPTNLISFPFMWLWCGGWERGPWNQLPASAPPLPTCAALNILLNLSVCLPIKWEQ